MSGLVRRIRDIVRLAARDYVNEWQMSGCFVLALAAVLGPMMVLFGLKFGIVGSMVDELVQDPRNREVRPVGSGRYERAWLEGLAARPDVAFLVPQTRSIAATIELKSDSAPQIIDVELIPTAPGEPLLAEGTPVPVDPKDIVLSATAADKLRLEARDTVDGSIARRFRGRSERVHLPLRVAAVARPAAFSRDGAFATLELVEAIEDFRDGRAVPWMGWSGDEDDGERTFPSFRLYARSIYDVADLRELLAGEGIDVRTRAADIEVVQSMDRNLTAVFWVIAVIGLVGFSLSLGASLWANVDRKRRELSVLRLVGFRTADIVWFPVVQSALTAVAGWAAASGIYLGVAYTINVMLAPQLEAGQTVCRLLPLHFAVALALTLGSAVTAAMLGGLRASRIEPSEGLREI
ncbi:MAG: ABC transporter permease [Chromatiales bacterium]|jgi:putative ABC transport system permease protein